MAELLTVAEGAFVLKCSEDTVVRRFEKRTGIIDLGTANNGRRNRRYRVLRIPKGRAAVKKDWRRSTGRMKDVYKRAHPHARHSEDNGSSRNLLALQTPGEECIHAGR